MFKKLVLVFVVAFLLNWLWENFHSVLYVHYRLGQITQFILLRAAIFDAVVISVLVFVSQKFFGGKVMPVAIGSLAVSVAVELWALETGRWQYSDLMPLIPLLNIGLTPVIQLALTGWFSQKIVLGR